MQIAVLLGDLQKYSPCWYLAEHASRILATKASVETISPELPLFSEDLERENREPVHPAVEETRQKLRFSDGLLVCAPEYNGMPSPVVANAILWLSREPLPPLQGKPVLLAGASQSIDGTRSSRPALRKLCENTGAHVLSQDIFVARGQETFSSSEEIALLQDDLREKLSELLLCAQKSKMSPLENHSKP